jgi:hypothetical protein
MADELMTYQQFLRTFGRKPSPESEKLYQEFRKAGGSPQTALTQPGAILPPEKAGQVIAQAAKDQTIKKDAEKITSTLPKSANEVDKFKQLEKAKNLSDTEADYNTWLQTTGQENNPDSRLAYEAIKGTKPIAGVTDEVIPDNDPRIQLDTTMSGSSYPEWLKDTQGGVDSQKARSDYVSLLGTGGTPAASSPEKNIQGPPAIKPIEPVSEIAPPKAVGAADGVPIAATPEQQGAVSPEVAKGSSEVIENVVADTGLGTKKDPAKIDWNKVGEIAKDTGQSVIGILQSAIAGWLAAKQDRGLDFENETILGKKAAEKRTIAGEQRKMQAEQETLNRQLAAQEKVTAGDRDWQMKLKTLDQNFQAEQQKIQMDFEQKMKQAMTDEQRAEAQKDRDAAMSRLQLQGKQAMDQMKVAGKATPGATADPLGLR